MQKKPEKTDEPILRSCIERMDEQTEEQSN